MMTKQTDQRDVIKTNFTYYNIIQITEFCRKNPFESTELF